MTDEPKVTITIEGIRETPVIIENIDQFALFASLEDRNKLIAQCDIEFSGYVAARAQTEFMEFLKGGDASD